MRMYVCVLPSLNRHYRFVWSYYPISGGNDTCCSGNGTCRHEGSSPHWWGYNFKVSVVIIAMISSAMCTWYSGIHFLSALENMLCSNRSLLYKSQKAGMECIMLHICSHPLQLTTLILRVDGVHGKPLYIHREHNQLASLLLAPLICTCITIYIYCINWYWP